MTDTRTDKDAPPPTGTESGTEDRRPSGVTTGSDVLAALASPLAPAAEGESGISPAILMATDVVAASSADGGRAEREPERTRESVWREQTEARPRPAESPVSASSREVHERLGRAILSKRAWTRSLLELGGVFSLLAVVEMWLRGQIGFVGVEPCPYWAIVLPVAAARGVVAGLTAAGYATLLRALALWQTGVVDQWVELLDLERMFEPVLFAGFGYLIGELRDQLVERNARLAKGLRELRERQEQQQRESRLLQSANRELRRRLFDNSADFESLMNAVAGAESIAEGSVFERPLAMIEERCGATKCSVLLVMPDGSVDLAKHRGWDPSEIRERVEAANESLFVRRAISESLPIHCFHPKAVVPKTGPLLVAPISDGTGVVKALLCLDEIPPRRFRDSTIQTIVSIADWVAASLRRAGDKALPKGLRAAVRQILRGDRAVGGPEQLGRRLLLEDARSERQGLTAALITFNAVELEARIPGALDRVDRFLIDYLCPHLRLTDDFYRFGFPGYYVLVMTGTERDGARIVRDRLAAKLHVLDTAKIGRIEVDAFTPDGEESSLVQLLPKLSKNYYLGRNSREEAKCPVPLPNAANTHGDTVEFANRLRLELGVALRYSQELSILDFRSSEVDIGGGLMVARYLSNLPASVLRGTDGIYVIGEDRCVVLLSGTDCLNASKVWQRILGQLQESMPEQRFDALETDFLALDGSESQLLIDYFLGEEAPTDRELLSELELQQLEFSSEDLERFARGAFEEIAGEGMAGGLPFTPVEGEGTLSAPTQETTDTEKETDSPMTDDRDPFAFTPPLDPQASPEAFRFDLPPRRTPVAEEEEAEAPPFGPAAEAVASAPVFETERSPISDSQVEDIVESVTAAAASALEAVEETAMHEAARVLPPSADEELAGPGPEVVVEAAAAAPEPAPAAPSEQPVSATSPAPQKQTPPQQTAVDDDLLTQLKLKILDLARLCMGLPDQK